MASRDLISSAKNKNALRQHPLIQVLHDSSFIPLFPHEQAESKTNNSKEKRQKSLPKWNSLPNELWWKIFNYLDNANSLCNVGAVSRHWYELSRDPLLWKTLCRNQGIHPLDILTRENEQLTNKSVPRDIWLYHMKRFLFEPMAMTLEEEETESFDLLCFFKSLATEKPHLLDWKWIFMKHSKWTREKYARDLEAREKRSTVPLFCCVRCFRVQQVKIEENECELVNDILQKSKSPIARLWEQPIVLKRETKVALAGSSSQTPSLVLRTKGVPFPFTHFIDDPRMNPLPILLRTFTGPEQAPTHDLCHSCLSEARKSSSPHETFTLIPLIHDQTSWKQPTNTSSHLSILQNIARPWSKLHSSW